MSSSVALATPEGGYAEPRSATVFVGCGADSLGVQVSVFDQTGTLVDSAFYVSVP